MNEQIRKLLTLSSPSLEFLKTYMENLDWTHTNMYVQTIQSLQLIKELKDVLEKENILDATISSKYKHQELFKNEI